MKNLFLMVALFPTIVSGQQNSNPAEVSNLKENYIKSIDNLTLNAAYTLANGAMTKAFELDKKVSIAIWIY